MMNGTYNGHFVPGPLILGTSNKVSNIGHIITEFYCHTFIRQYIHSIKHANDKYIET